MSPTAEEIEDVVLAARYGDEESLTDLQAFMQNFGAEELASASDESGNTALHMAAANGHLGWSSIFLQLLESLMLSTVYENRNYQVFGQSITFDKFEYSK